MVNVVPRQGGPNAKTRGAAGPEGFGRGTSRGTTFTMIPPRFFDKMSFLQHPGLVKRDFFQVGFGQWTLQGVHWTLYHSLQWNTEIKLFNISSKRGVYYTIYHGLAIYREVTFVNVTSVAENTDTVFSDGPSTDTVHSLGSVWTNCQ